MLTDTDIKELERMAKLNLPDEERSEIKKYTEFLLAGKEASFIAGVGAGEIKPMIYACGRTNVLREDKQEKRIDRETLLNGAPEHDNGYFKVPKTVE